MNIEERKTMNTNIIQNLVLENRGKLSISGVLDVFSFDDQVVILETELGLLTVKGENLRINKLSIETSEVIVEGSICSINYSEKELDKKNSSFLGKIFKQLGGYFDLKSGSFVLYFFTYRNINWFSF